MEDVHMRIPRRSIEQRSDDVEMTSTRKRVADEPPEAIDEERLHREELFQMLICSLAQAQENDDPGFWMENGDWWSTEEARKGDLKEMQGLFDRVVMEPAKSDRVDEQAKFISSRMVRRTKGDAVKSRYCLRDFRHTAPEGGELYATTPSAAAVKVALAITSWRL